MLRVGLTGDLGSGKSTVARLLAAHGAHVFSSDAIGRALMQPGQPVFRQIVEHFGPAVLAPDGTLDRSTLARLAFDPASARAEELNAIVHPAVLEEQSRLLATLAASDPDSIAIVESALIFTTRHGGPAGWRSRFDAIVLVTAPDDAKVQRYVDRLAAAGTPSAFDRAAAAEDARRRLRLQAANQQHAGECIVLRNDGSPEALAAAVEDLWRKLLSLRDAKKNTSPSGF